MKPLKTSKYSLVKYLQLSTHVYFWNLKYLEMRAELTDKLAQNVKIKVKPPFSIKHHLNQVSSF